MSKNNDEIAIIVPKDHELVALEAGFEIDLPKTSEILPSGANCYRFECKRAQTKASVVLVFMNSQNNTNSRKITGEVLSHFKPNVIFLIGTSAGRPDVTKIGSVVFSSLVSDLRESKMNTTYSPRGEPMGLRSLEIFNDISIYAVRQMNNTLGQKVNTILNKSFKKNSKIASDDMPLRLDLQPKLIASADIHQGNPDFMQQVWNTNDKIVCYDMESAGFVEACQDSNVQYMIIRGISDHGSNFDARKKMRATISAAVFLKQFIEQGLKNYPYQTPRSKKSKENVDSDFELSVETLPNDDVLQKLVDLFIDGLSSSKKPLKKPLPIKTMWTLDWNVSMNRTYLKEVLPLEQETLLQGGSVERIMAHVKLSDILNHIALHSIVFAKSNSYKLHVPLIDTRSKKFSQVLQSSTLCPKLEIILVGNDVMYMDFPEVNGMRTFVKTKGKEIIQGFYDKLYDWWATNGARCFTIDNKEHLFNWLEQVETSLQSIEKYSHKLPQKHAKSKIDEIHSMRHLINAIKQIVDGNIGSLDKQWWKDTTPDYTNNFTGVNNNFLNQFFSDETKAIETTFNSCEKNNTKMSIIEIGCGTGRLLCRFIQKHRNKISTGVGVDFVDEMLTICNEEFGNLRGHFPYELIEADVMKFNMHMDDGIIISKSVKINNPQVNPLLANSKRLVLLLGTLANTNTEDRLKILNELKKSLKPGDQIFMSSYDGRHFRNQAYDLYGRDDVSKISGKTILVYDVDKRDYISIDTKRNRIFRTHWFLAEELIALFNSAHLDNVHLVNEESTTGVFVVGTVP